METREIIIANTKTQTRNRISTDATTLGELKQALRENDIDFNDMTFTEGITKTRLLEDNSMLPKDVSYKGKITNNLVILLTNTTKKIASGGEVLSRAEAFIYIKAHNLQDYIKKQEGKNYTNVNTTRLNLYITEYKNKHTVKTESSPIIKEALENTKVVYKDEPEIITPNKKKTPEEYLSAFLEARIFILVKDLYENCYMSKDDLLNLSDEFYNMSKETPVKQLIKETAENKENLKLDNTDIDFMEDNRTLLKAETTTSSDINDDDIDDILDDLGY